MKTIANSLIGAALCIASTIALSTAQAATAQCPLTLQNLKNGTYLIPDLACGYTKVTLQNGKGENDGVQAVFGQAVFGTVSNSKNATAVVHLAYHTNELGWLQELVFMQARGRHLVQVAEYVLDDRCTVRQLSIKHGECLVETADAGADQREKLTKIHLTMLKKSTVLEAGESTPNAACDSFTAANDMANCVVSNMSVKQ